MANPESMAFFYQLPELEALRKTGSVVKAKL